jgi:hypothetical protein
MINSEWSNLRDRIKAAADRLEPGLGAQIGAMTPRGARIKVSEVTGVKIENLRPIEAMRQMAEAMEQAASGK